MRPCRVVIWVALLAVVLAAGCGQGSQEGQGTGADKSSSGTQTRQETISRDGMAQPTTQGDETAGGETNPAVGEETAFTAAPEMRGGSEGAADSIQEVRFGEHEGYERAVIVFGSEGAPASGVPAWSLSSPDGEGYARITFPCVDTTSVSDGVFSGSIMDNFYVVRALGGGLFIDIFATGAFQYRVMELSDPGRLVLDYRPASVAL